MSSVKQSINSVKMHILKLCYSAMFLAIALFLPFLTGQVPQIGNMLCPMHFPIFLCGMVCGWQWGAIVGLFAPFVRFLLFGMPPLFPTGIAMAFELAMYGIASGVLFAVLPKKNIYIYPCLIISMIMGRFVWGGISFILSGISQSEFSFELFWTAAVANAIPGIILQILVIPPVVMAMRKAGLILNDPQRKSNA